MHIGVPKEIKPDEYRIGMTPAGVREAVRHGHSVTVQHNAAARIGFTDERYQAVGARIVNTADEVFATADMVVKVKEPQASEYPLLRAGQVLFTYLHLAPDPVQTDALQASGVTAFAYETITDDHGGLPLLAPMSEIAGRMAIQVGASALEIEHGGSGVLLGGVPGVLPARVVILGGGVVGTNAARMAIGLGADVTIVDKSLRRLAWLDDMFGPRAKTAHASTELVDELVAGAHLVVGAVLVPGAKAPKLVTRSMLATMAPGSALVDVAIDQGGCFETSRATTHSQPTYIVDGIVHYCVANMPGAVPRTSTKGLTNVTLPYIELIADHGLDEALRRSAPLRPGVNVMAGKVVNRPVADSHGLPYTALETLVDGVG